MGRKPTQNTIRAYGVQGKPAVVSPASGKTLVIHTASIENRSGASIDAGILRRYGVGGGQYVVGKSVDLDDPDVTDVTTTIQAGTEVTFFEAIDDGVLIQGRSPFGLVGFNIATSMVGGTIVFEYFNGTIFTALPTPEITPDYTGATDTSQLLVFIPPVDWEIGVPSGVGGSTDAHGLYALRIRASVAPGTPAGFDDVWVSEFLAFKEALADNGVLSLDYPDDSGLMLEAQEGLMPFFATANDKNTMTVIFGVNG